MGLFARAKLCSVNLPQDLSRTCPYGKFTLADQDIALFIDVGDLELLSIDLSWRKFVSTGLRITRVRYGGKFLCSEESSNSEVRIRKLAYRRSP